MVDPPQRSGALLVDRSDRGKLTFTGEQTLWFCDQLLTNQLVNLAPGQGAEALILSPHGRIVAALRLAHPAEGLVIADLEPPASRAAELAGFFGDRIFATRVAVHDATEEFGLITVIGSGPEAADAIAAAALDVTQTALPGLGEHASSQVGGVVIVRVARPGPGLELIATRDDVPRLLAALEGAGATPGSVAEYEQLRIRSGLARDRVDYDDGYLPQEAAMERAVHFAKGCYLGQEAVAMAQRGRVKRRLRQLRFEQPVGPAAIHVPDDPAGPAGPDDPAGPRPLFAPGSGEEVGRATSVSAPGEEPTLGIATVKTAVELGDVVEVGRPGGPRAVIQELPGTTTGPSLPSARQLRESLQR